jgi:hypothetical protein
VGAVIPDLDTLVWVGGALVALFGLLMGAISYGGSRKAKQIEAEGLRGNLKAIKTREEIDNEIAQDVDLAARARASGIVRPGSQ